MHDWILCALGRLCRQAFWTTAAEFIEVHGSVHTRESPLPRLYRVPRAPVKGGGTAGDRTRLTVLNNKSQVGPPTNQLYKKYVSSKGWLYILWVVSI